MRKTAKKLLATGLAAVLALTGMTALPNSSSTSQAAEGYSVYFACQTNGSWVFRNNCHDSTYGLGSEAFEGGLYDTEDCKWVEATTDEEKAAAAGHVPADVTDALNFELFEDKETTVTLSVTGAESNGGKLDFSDYATVHAEAASPNAFNTLFISTDIPYDVAEVVDCVVEFDGEPMNVHDGKSLFVPSEKEDAEGNPVLEIEILNSWLEDDDGNKLLAANEAYTALPTESIEYTLTLKKKSTGSTGTTEGTATQTPAATATVAPTATATSAAVATTSGVTTPATVKLSVAKKNKNVVVAAGKSKSVKFTAKAQDPATQAAVVTATVKGNKKVTAKVNGSKVKISAKKKAVKGSAAKVVLTSTNASGASVKTTINVAVQNKAKKIKAAKKSVTIKKGKTAKVVIKVTKAENKKAAITDTVKATVKKVAKVTKTQVKKGKVIITLKAKKKGSAKLNVKVGSQKAKVNVKVK